jgi:hypothetical protein
MMNRSMADAHSAIWLVLAGAAMFAFGGAARPAMAAQSPEGDSPGERSAPAGAPPAAAPLEGAPQTEAPAGSKPAALAESESESASWFERPPLTLSVGAGAKRWAVTFYGFVEADYIVDTTRSYHDSIGSALVARTDTYDGHNGRTQFSMRNTRLGLLFESPITGGFKPSAVIEGDFFGERPDTASEATFYNSPTFRVRHAYLKLQSDYVDVVAGQTYDVFGWQNYYFPCSVEFLGLPNQLFSRSTQFRLSHMFGESGPVSVEIAASAVRPAQRDSQLPDANGGLRININDWKGITTPGNLGTLALPLSVGVSGTARQFKVNAFVPPPAQTSNSATGWGVSVDVLLPVIPATSSYDRSNRLTLTGSFVTGTAIGDLINATGGATFPILSNPTQASPPPLYDSNADNGLVTFDTRGVVHTIDWQAFRAGLQYYLPGGRVIFAANYTQAHSKNMAQLFPHLGEEIQLLVRVADTSRYGDVNLFWDATPAVRFGISGQYTAVEYLDGDKPHNIRGMAQALYAF